MTSLECCLMVWFVCSARQYITNYLHRKDSNLNRLIRYAEMLKCGDIMKKYLEVLV